jgi:hypothetical protein
MWQTQKKLENTCSAYEFAINYRAASYTVVSNNPNNPNNKQSIESDARCTMETHGTYNERKCQVIQREDGEYNASYIVRALEQRVLAV